MSATETLSAPFVANEAARLRAAIVSAPSPALERTAPIHGEPHAIPERAREQHGILVARLRYYGIDVIETTPERGEAEARPLRDVDAQDALVQDGAIIFTDGAFLARPAEPARRAETATLERTLARIGVPIVGRITSPGLLDGGDALVAGDTLYVARYEGRAANVGVAPFVHGNQLGREQLAAAARERGLKVVEVTVASTVRRLRSIASVVDDETIVLAPGLLDASAFTGRKIVEAPPGEEYGAGVLALGGRRVLANLRFRTLIPHLRKAKIEVDAIDLWEFGKIGATPSSLALVVKRG